VWIGIAVLRKSGGKRLFAVGLIYGVNMTVTAFGQIFFMDRDTTFFIVVGLCLFNNTFTAGFSFLCFS
jgi:hypothetical protein